MLTAIVLLLNRTVNKQRVTALLLPGGKARQSSVQTVM